MCACCMTCIPILPAQGGFSHHSFPFVGANSHALVQTDPQPRRKEGRKEKVNNKNPSRLGNLTPGSPHSCPDEIRFVMMVVCREIFLEHGIDGNTECRRPGMEEGGEKSV